MTPKSWSTYGGKNYFDLQMACGAPVRWLKYTTLNAIHVLANILFPLNNKIHLVWFNISIETYKIKCKNCFWKTNPKVSVLYTTNILITPSSLISNFVVYWIFWEWAIIKTKKLDEHNKQKPTLLYKLWQVIRKKNQ